MEYKKLTGAELYDVFSDSVIADLEESSQQKKDDEILVYNLYRKWLTEYMIEKLELKKYDDELVNSDLNFKCIDEDKMDIYQYCSSNELKFLYIRNNIYIENLNGEEKEFIMKQIRNNRNSLDDEARKFIENTYQKVIFEDVGKDGKKYITFFGPNSRNYSARNDSLVIGMRYDELDLNGLSDDAWSELHVKQLMHLAEMSYKISVEQKDKLDIPITILQYNDFSVKPRSFKNKSRTEDLREER